MNSSFNKLLTFKTVITASMIIVFSINLLLMERVDALSDSRQLVLDAWTLVNEGFYDPEKFDEIQWKRIRQKTLQKQIETSEEAYSAIEDMLRPLDDPYTRVLRPKDYELLKSSNFGSEINGVGLQLGEDDNNELLELNYDAENKILCRKDEGFEDEKKEPQEWQADKFAAFMLMPTDKVRSVFFRIFKRPINVKRKRLLELIFPRSPIFKAYKIAEKIIKTGSFDNVSKMAMLNRLIGMKLVNGLSYQKSKR